MMYFILKENNTSVGVKVYKLVLYNLHSHRNWLSCTILHSKYALYSWWPTVLWISLELVLYLSMLSERFPYFGSCLQWRQWDQLWFRDSLNLNPLPHLTQRNHLALRDMECAVCDRGYFSILMFTVFSSQDYPPFPVNFFIESSRNAVLYLPWNCFAAAYSHGLSVWKTEPLACFMWLFHI